MGKLGGYYTQEGVKGPFFVCKLLHKNKRVELGYFLGAILPVIRKEKVKQVIKGCDYKEDVQKPCEGAQKGDMGNSPMF